MAVLEKIGRLRLSLTTKTLIIFLLLSIISLAIVGAIAFTAIRGVGDYALESNKALGDSAVLESTGALQNLGERMIEQKALDTAAQIEMYFRAHPELTLDDLSGDEELRTIAVQPIGQTGYTAIVDANRFVILVHKFPENEGKDLTSLSTSLPSFWEIIQASAGGASSSGYYDWIEPDGSANQKYAFIAPIRVPIAGAEKGLTLWSTTYITEFSAPVNNTRIMIENSAADTGRNINNRISRMQNTFIGVYAAVLLAVFILSFWLARTITRPVQALTKGARVIGQGNLDYSVDVKTGDEIEDLANSFNKMAEGLKAQIEIIRLTTAEKERVQKELEIAKGIQKSFLPESSPQIEGFDLAALNTPALEVGGDFYDFIPVSLNKWGLVIADVSGKGVPAALFMALSRTMIRANATNNPTPSRVIRQANDMISEDVRSNMFVTLFYGVLDPERKTLTYVNAGHNPPLVMGKNSGDVIMLATKGVALGLMTDVEFEEKEILLSKGDILVLYTDGVTEAINRKQELFGQERISRLVDENKHLSAQEIINLIEKEVFTYSDGQPQFDDITLLLVKVI
ncbi:MAG: SpoIIE family protein phosphatase [Dehalococcoidales bacterium]|nr:SpoIIE family protein phosphatase [Dehalococcoidales bacterium]